MCRFIGRRCATKHIHWSYYALLLRLSSSGVHVASQRFGDSSPQFFSALVNDSAGDVVVAGAFAGTMDLGAGNLTSANGSLDALIGKLHAGGAHVFSRADGDIESDRAFDAGVDETDHIFVAGHFQDSIDFGVGPLTAGANAMDLFVVKLMP
jgi:hypothetical protein